MSAITENVRRILAELPKGVTLTVAAKGRTPAEVKEAIEAGASIVGENYVQEAQAAFGAIGKKVKWHCIGHLQKNKIKTAVALFDMIETVDSPALAGQIDAAAAALGKTVSVLIEVNSAHEPQKSGVMPGELEKLVRYCAGLSHVALRGLMTMGPLKDNPEEVRPYFKETKKLFESMKASNIPHVTMHYLSMGMSDTYRIAVEEGANLVRVGTKIFGPRA